MVARENAEGLFQGDDDGLRGRMVLAPAGMIATAHPLASATGLAMLQRGGNAMDAALAASAVCNVVLPQMCGLGGDTFFLYYEASSGKTYGLNSSGPAPAAASREEYVRRGGERMPFFGPLSVGVPGAVDAYLVAAERFASRPLDELFAPAIAYARDGHPLTAGVARAIAASAGELAKWPASAATFLPGGRPPAPGRRFANPALARSLRLVADGGRAAFYEGALGERIVGALREAGALFTMDDWASHRADLYEPPIATVYRGKTVYQTTLPSQGHILLEELNIVEGDDLAALGHNSPAAIHLLVEAKKLAFADRLAYSGDPRFVDTPLETLISKEFAAGRRAQIDPRRAADAPRAGLLPERVADTTYLCVVDRWGNACSYITSLSASLGSGFVAGDTGILLNNRVGRGFTLEAGHPNVLAGGKRTVHTLNCFLVVEEGRPWLVGGTPGGDGQPQWNLQLLTNVIDYGLDPQAAIEALRWTSFPGTDPINAHHAFELRIEDRVGPETIRQLAERGHRVKPLGPWSGGGAAQLIAIGADGVLRGGSDPRAEGQALGC
ncbi:MAG: gamma-glutamyltransferase [Chloroflexota bacterium]|nr:gamma-glutamyltransferase [Chloroflexota bacterium]